MTEFGVARGERRVLGVSHTHQRRSAGVEQVNPPVTSVIAKRRLRLFGHLARADPSQDHSRILRVVLQRIGDAGQVDQGGHGSVQ